MNWPIAGDDGIHGQVNEVRIALFITPANWTAATLVTGDVVAGSVPGMMETVIGGLITEQVYHVAVKATDEQAASSWSTWSLPQRSTGPPFT